MPELPDLLYIRDFLSRRICGKRIVNTEVKQPVVVRNGTGDDFRSRLKGKKIESVAIHGPFLKIGLSENLELILNLMLAGRLQLQTQGDKPIGHMCVRFLLEEGVALNFGDDQKMGKIYLINAGDYDHVPGFVNQGVDILSERFTLDEFFSIAKQHSRKQIRVFINTHSALSSIGNAYADEILFEAGVHPKTITDRLTREELTRLHETIKSVLEWGIDKVRGAAQPIHVKVRDHMKVRNKHGEPCPRCNTRIRREGVRGYDVFFCPTCQPTSRKLFIDWSKV